MYINFQLYNQHTVSPKWQMEPQSIQAPVFVDSLNPIFFAYDKQVLGFATTHQYIYAFFPDKIRVFEHLASSLIPQIVQEIHICNKKIRLFTVSQLFIAVLFEDNGLQIRSRQFWEKMQYQTAFTKNTDITHLEISSNKLIYKFVVQKQTESRHCLGFIDVHGKQGPKIWENTQNIQKLIYKDKFKEMPDFYFTKEVTLMKFGFLYTDESSYKPYEIGKIQISQTKILDIGIIESLIPAEQPDYLYEKKNTKKLFLIKLIQFSSEQNGQTNRKLKLIYSKLNEHAQQIEIHQDQHPECLFNKFQQIIDSIQQLEDSTSQLNKLQNQRQVQIDLKDGDKFEKMIIQGSSVYINLNTSLIQYNIDDQQLKLRHLFSKKESDVLVGIGQNFVLLMSQSWTTALLKKELKNHTQKVIKQQICNKKDFELQTDALDQFDEKYMNEIIDKLFEKKKVYDIGIQTDFNVLNVSTNQCSVQEINQNIDSPVQKEKEEVQQQIKQVEKIKQVYHHHHQTIKYFPSKDHNGEIQKLNDNLRQLQCDIQYKFSTKITDILKNEHEKLKQSCLMSLKKICEQQIAGKIIPKMEEKLGQIFQTKLHEINQYIYSLSIQNLYNLRDQFEKDKVNQRMLQNQLMKKQIFQVEECKKSVLKMVEINKIRELQKIIFFEEIRKKFIDIETQINKLESKVKEIMLQEDQNQNQFVSEIQTIKGLLSFKQDEKDDFKGSDEDSSRKSQYNDKDQVQSEASSSESDSSESESSEGQVSIHMKSYPKMPPRPMHPPQSYYGFNPPPMHYPPSNFYPERAYLPQTGYQQFNPYQNYYQLSHHGYPATKETYPFYPPMLEAPRFFEKPERKIDKKKKPKKK